MSTITHPATGSHAQADNDWFSVVALRLLALLLMFAASAKGYAGWRDHSFSFFLATQITGELGLSAWMISAVRVNAARRAALLAFSAFTAASLYKFLRQAPACGCFGHASLSANAMFLIDLAIVCLLLIVRRYSDGKIVSFGIRVTAAAIIFTAGLAVVGFVGFFRSSHTSSAVPPPVLNTQTNFSTKSTEPLVESESLPLHADYIATATSTAQWMADIGDLAPGKSVTVLFRLSSPTAHVLEIRGISTSCGCTNVPDPPKVIPAIGTADVVVKFHAPDQTANFESEVLLTTSDPSLPPLQLTIRGGVR
jgi:Protein of unknown function (DUF1573)